MDTRRAGAHAEPGLHGGTGTGDPIPTGDVPRHDGAAGHRGHVG